MIDNYASENTIDEAVFRSLLGPHNGTGGVIPSNPHVIADHANDSVRYMIKASGGGTGGSTYIATVGDDNEITITVGED